MKSGWIGTGPKGARFEESFREYLGTPNTVAESSCTSTLHLSLLAADVRAGDEVVKRCRENWATYDSAFAELPLGVPPREEPDTAHARHLHTVSVDCKRHGVSPVRDVCFAAENE